MLEGDPVHPSKFPVETPIPILDPTLLLGILLVVLTVALLAYYVGKYDGRRTRDEQRRAVPKAVHEAIMARCMAATSAPPAELLDRAKDLIEEVQWRIGPVLAFGGPCAKALAGMTEALAGEPAEEGGKGGPAGRKDDKANLDHGGLHKEAELELATANAAIPGGQTQVLAGLRPGFDLGQGSDKSKEEEAGILDHKDYSRQVHMAVVEFSDFWSRGDCLNELDHCQKALAQTSPPPEPSSEAD